MEYITLEELKYSTEMTGFSFADLNAQIAISATSRAIEEYTGVLTFGTIADTRYFTPMEYQYLAIDDLISCSTFATDNDGDGVFETSWTLNRDYVLAPFNALAWGKPFQEAQVHPRGTRRFVPWPRSVSVVGTFGWPSIPDPVKHATLIMASRLLRRAREAPFGVVGLGLDNAAVRISRPIDSDICFLLDPFVRDAGGALVA